MERKDRRRMKEKVIGRSIKNEIYPQSSLLMQWLFTWSISIFRSIHVSPSSVWNGYSPTASSSFPPLPRNLKNNIELKGEYYEPTFVITILYPFLFIFNIQSSRDDDSHATTRATIARNDNSIAVPAESDIPFFPLTLLLLSSFLASITC